MVSCRDLVPPRWRYDYTAEGIAPYLVELAGLVDAGKANFLVV
jgi:hypothetical protein